MGLVTRLIGNGKQSGLDGSDAGTTAATGNTDGALDTLCCVLRTMGDQSFPLDDGMEAAEFQALCEGAARHAENGAAVPDLGIPEDAAGVRNWGLLRRFYVDRRQREAAYVGGSMQDYQSIVDDLVTGLREIGRRDTDTAMSVKRNLRAVEKAVASGKLGEIKATLQDTMQNVAQSFEEQKRSYEHRIGDLTERMNSLRKSLVAAREEMKRDTLTGAYNRGAFDTAVAQSLNLNFILNQPVTVMLVDLDHFKNINDTYGHAAGDQVLRAVSDCLARTFVRKTDLVSRFGGDEFAVVLIDTNGTNSTSLLTRFMHDIAAIAVPGAGDDVRVSCSVGYTEVAPGDTVELLVKRADAALYEVKAAGRNGYRYRAAAPAADS